jgi:AcrR family transcriptional regulator
MSRWKPDAEGRLTTAAINLFAERGYDATTVAAIAEAAGLTKRTFFRYFTDKREVLFNGSRELQERWIGGIRAAAPDFGPLAAVSEGLADVAELFADRHAVARTRARIVATHPELQERELIKLHTLSTAIAEALLDRGVSERAAILAAHVGVTVFHVAFADWVQHDDPGAFRRLIDDSLQELRSVTSL